MLIYAPTRQPRSGSQPVTRIQTLMARRTAYLSIDQPADTPYAEASKYVKKSVARMLIRRAEVDYISDKIIREKPAKRLETIGSVATSVDEIKRYEASLPHRVHQKIWRATKIDQLPEPSGLDLNYPEALRTTVIHPHHAMREACRDAARRKACSGE